MQAGHCSFGSTHTYSWSAESKKYQSVDKDVYAYYQREKDKLDFSLMQLFYILYKSPETQEGNMKLLWVRAANCKLQINYQHLGTSYCTCTLCGVLRYILLLIF